MSKPPSGKPPKSPSPPKPPPPKVVKPASPPAAKPAPPKALPITDPKIATIAGKTLHKPENVTTKQSQELAASVLAHIEPRGPGKKP